MVPCCVHVLQLGRPAPQQDHQRRLQQAPGCHGLNDTELSVVCSWGGRHIRTITNAVFSNGLLDPWHPGGVLKDLNPTAVAIIIPEGAHHLDVRPLSSCSSLSILQFPCIMPLHLQHQARWPVAWSIGWQAGASATVRAPYI